MDLALDGCTVVPSGVGAFLLLFPSSCRAPAPFTGPAARPAERPSAKAFSVVGSFSESTCALGASGAAVSFGEPQSGQTRKKTARRCGGGAQKKKNRKGEVLRRPVISVESILSHELYD